MTRPAPNFRNVEGSIDVLFCIPHEPRSSGLSIHALRWASLCQQFGISSSIRFMGDEATQSPSTSRIIMGLPADPLVAQKLINEGDPRRTALLWERNGYSYETLERGVQIPTALHRILPRLPLNNPTPNTHYIPTLIPDVFLECGDRPLRLRPRRAVFLGRYSRSKGAFHAASFWEESISGWSGDSLSMLGLGLGDSDASLQVKSVADRCPQILLDHLPNDDERADFLSGCRIGLFLGTQDFYPQALLEAMAAGVATIATPIPGYAPAIEDGRAIQISSENHLVAETRRILAEPSQQDHIMVQKARDFVRRFHGREVVWQHFARFFQSFL